MNVNCASGGYSTASDLGRFYSALLTQLAHGSVNEALPAPDTARAMLLPGRSSGVRPVFSAGRAPTDWASWSTEIRNGGRHAPNRASAISACSDVRSGWPIPNNDLALGVILNGVTDSYFTEVRQSALLESVYADLGV